LSSQNRDDLGWLLVLGSKKIIARLSNLLPKTLAVNNLSINAVQVADSIEDEDGCQAAGFMYLLYSKYVSSLFLWT
jgi:hypothetical protein